ncbi:MAG: hypothetical protein ACRERU_09975 [Methylococcales bacterium]
MKSFRKKSSGLACAAAITGALLAPAAEAVNLATDLVGDVAIAPYYTTRGGWQTLINLTNTQNVPIVVKVRIHESANSRDVLDFNVGLSAFDVFSAVLREGPNGTALVSTDSPDATGLRTCTIPSVVGTAAAGTPASAQGYGVTNPNTGATDTSYDGGITSIDRLREGYIEFIVMGFTDPADPSGLTPVVDPVTGVIDVAEAIEQKDCANLDIAFTPNSNTTTSMPRILESARQFGEPINALKFNFRLLNGSRGVEAGTEAATWANFYNAPGQPDAFIQPSNNATCTHTRGDTRQGIAEWVPGGGAAGVLPAAGPGGATIPGSTSCDNLITAQTPFPFLEPSLNDAFPATANYWDDFLNQPLSISPTDTSLAVDARVRGADAMSLTIQRTAVVDEWSSNAALGVTTDWIVTMPTKGFYVDQVFDQATASPPSPLPYLTFAQATGALPFGPTYGVQFAMTGGRPESYLDAGAGLAQTPPLAPFQNAFERTIATDPGSAVACNDIGFNVFDRAEQSIAPTPGGGPIVSPAPPVIVATDQLCNEANVVIFNGRSALFPVGPLDIDTSALTNTTGWMLLTLDDFAGAQIAVTQGTLSGLPVVGFNLKQRTFGNVTTNFASAINHSFLRGIPQ